MGHDKTAILRIDGSRTGAGGFRLVYKDQDIVLSAVAFKTWLRVLLSRVEGEPNDPLPADIGSREIHALKHELARQRASRLIDVGGEGEWRPDKPHYLVNHLFRIPLSFEDIEFDWDSLAEVDDDKIAHVLAELKAALHEVPLRKTLRDEGDPLGLKDVVLGGDDPTLSSEYKFSRKQPPESSE